MPDIRHRVGTTAPRARVYEAFATTDGLRVSDPGHKGRGHPVGSNLEFFFGTPEPSAVMEVVEAGPRPPAWRGAVCRGPRSGSAPT